MWLELWSSGCLTQWTVVRGAAVSVLEYHHGSVVLQVYLMDQLAGNTSSM